MAVIKMQESELLKMSKDTGERRQELKDIQKTLRAATEGSGWRSDAAKSFKSVWEERQKVLSELDKVLDEWKLACDQHAKVAANVNQPFRG
jgi:uncharacterized protein YukE